MNELRIVLSDYTFQTVAVGAALLGILNGVLGTFLVLRRQSLLGDGVSHAALPGVVAAFLLTGSRQTEVLLLGALLSGLLATYSIYGVHRNSRIRFDSALALVMSVFFGLGMVLLTYAQKRPDATQAGIKRFIYGQASTLIARDIKLLSVAAGILILWVILFWKEFKVLSFDEPFAQTLGFPTGRLGILLSLATVVAIILGLQTVGVVLMSAMLITPAVAARQWSDHLAVVAGLSALFGAVSGVGGTLISSLVPGMPTGPVIVLCVSILALFSLLFAPRRGILARAIHRRKGQRQLMDAKEGRS
ncbi:Manganese ABC transporter, inner membrane permease protein SitC [Clostridiaceae bacterium JG1575]|nr:Manganese ABC transporter, inner membrane permease protein SitC [Clostridiaceae bacterium JG1575]